MQELEATIAARGGDRKKGYELFRKAADREAAMLYTEPPSYPRPVVEGLGERRAGARRLRDRREGVPRNAASASRAAAAPTSGWRRRSTGLGKTAEARDARERAAKAWANADANLPQVQKLRKTTAPRSSNRRASSTPCMTRRGAMVVSP